MTNDTYRKLVDNAANDSDCGYCANDVQEMRPGMRRKQVRAVENTQSLFSLNELQRKPSGGNYQQQEEQQFRQ